MKSRIEQKIPQLVQLACVLESCAPKPGNVNRYHDFSDTSLEDYLLSGAALGSAFENASREGIGQMILDAAASTHRIVRSNTNLGMILLFAPLVKASVSAASAGRDIRGSLRSVLSSLTVEDARLAYAAIRLMQPGGMGKAAHADISEEPTITLGQSMALAREHDAVAREYATGYGITFEIGLPALKSAYSRSGHYSDAIVQTFLTILKDVPDTLIARKAGRLAADRVTRLANEVLKKGGVFAAKGQEALAEMDRALRDKSHKLNPGTTADLTAASLLIALIEESL